MPVPEGWTRQEFEAEIVRLLRENSARELEIRSLYRQAGEHGFPLDPDALVKRALLESNRAAQRLGDEPVPDGGSDPAQNPVTQADYEAAITAHFRRALRSQREADLLLADGRTHGVVLDRDDLTNRAGRTDQEP
jgi:hypothetical protein